MKSPKTLVLGGGGREHALCWHLKKAGISVEAAPGSKAIEKLCPTFNFKNFEDLSIQLKSREISSIIVGPEKYLDEGVADFFSTSSIKVFGPTKNAARLETDKAFSKHFLVKYGVPTARSATLKSLEDLKKELKNFKAPFVIKASGLAAGKGVWIGSDLKEAEAFSNEALKVHPSLVIEEFLSGEELSYFIMVDGENHLFLGAAQDHKRLLENDHGPNTGGMGAYSPVPLLTVDLQKRIEEKVIAPTIRGLKSEGIYYRGFLFVGLMIVNEEPYVLEFNCRLGDPETQALMMRLETPLTDLIERVASAKNLSPATLSRKVSLNVVVAAKGYPDSPKKGFLLKGIENPPSEIFVFHSGTSLNEENWIASGGRLFSVSTAQNTLLDCQRLIYPWIESFSFLNEVTFRKDIGVKAYRHLFRVDSKITQRPTSA